MTLREWSKNLKPCPFDDEAFGVFSAWALSRCSLGPRRPPLADGHPLRPGVHTLVRHVPLERRFLGRAEG